MAIYPGAIWRGPVPNVGGPIGQVRLGVVHVMQGTLAGSDSWFHESAAQVSAHFGVGQDGTIYQWVDTAEIAWAEASYNDVAISIEHEGNSGDSLTPQQITADQALVRWLASTCGIPLVRNTNPAGAGWIGHGELGVAGGNHPDCPGAPILAQWPLVLAGSPTPPPAPAPSYDTDHTEVLMGLASSEQDAFNAQAREWWTLYRTDNFGAYVVSPGSAPVNAISLLWLAYKTSFNGSIDAVLARIIDDGRTRNVLRKSFDIQDSGAV